MAHTSIHDAVVLHTYDVGEADRFCVLLTREHGRLAARAQGARRPGSRSGGLLLPFRCVTVELAASATGHVVRSVRERQTPPCREDHLDRFRVAGRGIELLLLLLHDEEPLPEIFRLCEEFLILSADATSHPFTPFALRLLARLGVLPTTPEDARFARLTPEDQRFVIACAGHGEFPLLCILPTSVAVARFLESVLTIHLPRALRAPAVAAAIGPTRTAA